MSNQWLTATCALERYVNARDRAQATPSAAPRATYWVTAWETETCFVVTMKLSDWKQDAYCVDRATYAVAIEPEERDKEPPY